MLVILEKNVAIIIWCGLFVIGIITYITIKRQSKSIICKKCGNKMYVEQMKIEYCSECGEKIL